MSDQPKKYILYCAQEAGFCTRSMLIPYDKIMKCPERAADLEVLRKNSLKDVKFTHKNKEYVVDNLLNVNIMWENNIGSQQPSEFIHIITDFTQYAEFGVDDYNGEKFYSKKYDSCWADDIICNVVANGVDHVSNYCTLRNKTFDDDNYVNIVEGFLVLENHIR